MERIETVEAFKRFISTNHEQIFKHMIKIENIPNNDEWIQENEWDKIYEQEVIHNRNI